MLLLSFFPFQRRKLLGRETVQTENVSEHYIECGCVYVREGKYIVIFDRDREKERKMKHCFGEVNEKV